jgi:polyisoprenoid-binding protein YceI
MFRFQFRRDDAAFFVEDCIVLRLPMIQKASLAPLICLIALILWIPGAHAQEWALNKQQSQITFEIISADTSVAGSFGQFEAEIRFDPEYLDVTDIRAAVDMNTVRTGDAQLDDALRSSPWFDTQSYPAAAFRTTALEEGDNENSYIVQGNLTIRGISRPVSIPVGFSVHQGDATVTGEIAINRQEFGIGADNALKGQASGDLVIIRLKLVTTRLDN